MKKALFAVLIAASGMGFFCAAAHAADVKYPDDKDPAFTFSMPDDWTRRLDSAGNLLINSTNKACDLSLTMVDDAATAKGPLDDLHKLVFQAAKVDDLNKQEDAELGGKKGTAYYGEVKIPNSGTLSLKLILVKLDDTHVASLTVVTTTVMTDADNAGLAKLLGSLKFTAVK